MDHSKTSGWILPLADSRQPKDATRKIKNQPESGFSCGNVLDNRNNRGRMKERDTREIN
jgi:hypothetical protein